uniref:Uncharacterized protein n=1 Tax=Cucumis melo TaxID=3656 RepID=A0A9I9E9H4_CUCME
MRQISAEQSPKIDKWEIGPGREISFSYRTASVKESFGRDLILEMPAPGYASQMTVLLTFLQPRSGGLLHTTSFMKAIPSGLTTGTRSSLSLLSALAFERFHTPY